jgi:hypothetical protein
MGSRFRVVLVATLIAFFLTFHLLFQNGYISTERIQKLFDTFGPWKAGLAADDEYLIGVGKADITGYATIC